MNISKEKPSCLSETVFYHTEKYYIAKFKDKTIIKKWFEDPNNDEEYKVETTSKEEIIASPKKLIIVGSLIYGYSSHCYKCKDKIDGDFMERCKKCSWYICDGCKACGCGYYN